MQDKYPIETKNGVLLHNAKEAIHHVQHLCDDCPQNNILHPCSGAQASQCNAYKQQILDTVRKIGETQMTQYLLLRTNGIEIEILQKSHDLKALQVAMKADYESMIPFDWSDSCSCLSVCDEIFARLHVDDDTTWNWQIQEIEMTPFTESGDVDKAKQFVDSCHFYVKDQIYRHLWKQHVTEDVRAHMQDMGVELTEDEIDFAAYRYVYEGNYDCNLSYWDNIENNINEVLSQRSNE